MVNKNTKICHLGGFFGCQTRENPFFVGLNSGFAKAQNGKNYDNLPLGWVSRAKWSNLLVGYLGDPK